MALKSDGAPGVAEAFDGTAINAVLLASVGVIATFAGLSLFAFPSADDFCYAVRAHDLGFVGAQREWYLGWSGRYSASALISGFTLAGGLDRFYWLAAILVLVVTAAAFFGLLLALGRPRYSRRLLLAASLGLCVLFLAGLPDVAQTVYWATGSLTYQLGNVALLLLLTLAAREERSTSSRWWASLLRFVAAAVVALVAVGANEATLLCVLVLTGCGATVAAMGRRRTVGFWVGVLIVATIGALASVLAPGNASRAASLTSSGMLRPQAWLAVLLFMPWVVLRVGYWLSNVAIWASAFLLLLVTWGDAQRLLRPSGRVDRRWLLVPIVWLGVILLVNGLGFAVNRYPLPERAESVTYLVFLLGWYPSAIVLYHAFIGDRFGRPSTAAARWAVVGLILGLVGAPNVFEAFKDVYRGYRYRREMTTRLELIRRASGEGVLDLEVPSLSRPPRTLFATELTTDPGNSRNLCPARYYGLRSLRLGSSPGSIPSTPGEM